jgi:hypothetical protein
MPSWGEIRQEIATAPKRYKLEDGVSAFDAVRRQYLVKHSATTQRAVILYATKWTEGAIESPQNISIAFGDVHGLMETTHKIKEKSLDLIIHSPGGSPEAAEAIVTYLRSIFSNIRVIIPHMAMSAATMIACAADRIVMGKHSFIGPIDPQLQIMTPVGPRAVACQSVLAQFEQAQRECVDPSKINAWIPMLSQFGPDLLQLCLNATQLGKSLVKKWLCENMFASHPDGNAKANHVAEWLGTHNNFLTHGRPISRVEAIGHGLVVENLEDDPALQDLVLSIYHATSHTFSGTGAVKIIENHVGRAYIIQMQQVFVEAGGPSPPSIPTPPSSVAATPAPPRAWKRGA